MAGIMKHSPDSCNVTVRANGANWAKTAQADYDNGGGIMWGGMIGRPRLPRPLSRCLMLYLVPRPKTEREAWEHELREELPALLAAHQQELATTPAENRERREWLEWQIRRVEKRMMARLERKSA